jgi:UDP-N-acetylmuramoylalanine--D-glutamate ligase
MPSPRRAKRPAKPRAPKRTAQRAAKGAAKSAAPRTSAGAPSRTPSRASARSAADSPAREVVQGLPPPVAIVGYGVEGRGTLAFLRSQGVEELAVFDRALDAAAAAAPELAGLPVHGAGDWGAALAACGSVVRSPGVRPDHPGLAAARAVGARITSATELFLAACPGPVAGVTGTLGKGTTVSLLEAALNAGGVAARAAGNIGLNPLELLPALDARTVTVLELSSFQLMGLAGRKPDVAVVLRTTSEHLDWHRDVAEYRAAKRGLLAPSAAGQCVVFCADSAGACEVVGAALPGALAVSRRGPVGEGIGVGDGHVLRFGVGRTARLEPLERLALPGAFNLENAAAALLAAEALGAAVARAAEAIAAFTSLPHRLQRVAEAGGVTFYDDSYATRPDATLGALGAFPAAPLALIAGGSEKHADFAPLAEALCAHPTLARLVLIGSTAPRIAGEVQAAAARLGRPAPSTVRAESLEGAFSEARAALPQGGVLLFSPACASFDMFPNYKVRGERFTALARAATR